MDDSRTGPRRGQRKPLRSPGIPKMRLSRSRPSDSPKAHIKKSGPESGPNGCPTEPPGTPWTPQTDALACMRAGFRPKGPTHNSTRKRPPRGAPPEAQVTQWAAQPPCPPPVKVSGTLEITPAPHQQI